MSRGVGSRRNKNQKSIFRSVKIKRVLRDATYTYNRESRGV